MIPTLPRWSWTWLDGTALLVPPEGPSRGGFRYRDRLRPLRPATRLAAEDLDDGFVAAATSAPERRVTAEGEYAAAIRQEGTVGGRPALRLLGYVFGDDHHARLSALVLAPEQAPRFQAVFDALLHADAQHLGVRRRRFLHQPPPGWSGRRLDTFHSAWYPPDHPRDPTRLLVFPALPLRGDARSAIGIEVLADEPLRDFVPDVQMGPVRARAGALAAARFQVTGSLAGRPLVRDVVLLHDQHHVYPLAIDSHPSSAARSRATLDAVARSVVPLPRPSRPGGEAIEKLIDHWI